MNECGDKAIIYQSLLLATLIFERWLGRTQKTQASNTIDLFLNLLVKLAGFIWRKKDGN